MNNDWTMTGHFGTTLLEPKWSVALEPLNSYSDEELQKLIDSDEAVEEYVRQLDQCKEIVNLKSLKEVEVKSLADYNLSFQNNFEARKSTLKALSQQITEVSESVKAKMEEVRGKSGCVTAETALALLQTAASEIEEESETLADQFYQKEIDVEKFLEQFQKARERMHSRRVKADKMTEILSKPTPVAKRPAPPPPYPVGPLSMMSLVNNN